jgi:hypothetical protein
LISKGSLVTRGSPEITKSFLTLHSESFNLILSMKVEGGKNAEVRVIPGWSPYDYARRGKPVPASVEREAQERLPARRVSDRPVKGLDSVTEFAAPRRSQPNAQEYIKVTQSPFK